MSHLKYITEDLKFPTQLLCLCIIRDKQSDYSWCSKCSLQCHPSWMHFEDVNAMALSCRKTLTKTLSTFFHTIVCLVFKQQWRVNDVNSRWPL